jgi:hypothetical protein
MKSVNTQTLKIGALKVQFLPVQLSCDFTHKFAVAVALSFHSAVAKLWFQSFTNFVVACSTPDWSTVEVSSTTVITRQKHSKPYRTRGKLTLPIWTHGKLMIPLA